MFVKLLTTLNQRAVDERGAVAGEYAVLLALIAVALVAVIGLFTGAIVRAFNAAIAVLPA